MNELSALSNGLDQLIKFFVYGSIFTTLFIIYLVLSIWYNTRQTKVNSDKIYDLLKSQFTEKEIKLTEEEWETQEKKTAPEKYSEQEWLIIKSKKEADVEWQEFKDKVHQTLHKKIF